MRDAGPDLGPHGTRPSRGQIDRFGARARAERLRAVGLHQAGCEWIPAPPLPFASSLLICRTTCIDCLMVPPSRIEAAGWMTPVLTGLIAGVFPGLTWLTEEQADPFGTPRNSLLLDAICRNMGSAWPRTCTALFPRARAFARLFPWLTGGCRKNIA